MTSMRKSNRTMLASIIALSLCFVLLLGATLAWFEATVVNSGNSVTAGAYGSDMDLEVLGEDDVTWNDVENPFFACTNWMPGSTAVKVLRVSNTGDTHLYWDLSFVKTADEANLSDVIDVYYKWDVDKNTTDITGWEKIGTMTECITDGKLGQVLRGELYAGETRNLALALQMQADAGAQYQEKLLTFNISMYITDKPFAGWAVKDSVAVTPDAEGKLTEGATISASTPDENAVVSEAVVTVPAGVAIAEGASTLKLSVTEGTVPDGVEIGDGREAIALNISLDGLSPDNDQPVTVTLTIEQGLQNVVLYHNGKEVKNFSYDAATGVLTFTTTSFSPFTIVHGAPVALPTYTVKFVDWNNAELKSETVEHGAAATAPTPPEVVGYTFDKWDVAYDNVTSDLTVKAIYTINKYTVTFVDHEGNEISKQENVDYGTKVVAPADPTRESTVDTTYTFAGWKNGDAEPVKDLPAVTGNVTYKATYTEAARMYTITWVVGDTETEEEYEYDATPSHEDPEKAADEKSTYTFKGWSSTADGEKLDTLPKVTGDATYYAVFESAPRMYTITFNNENGSEFATKTLEYGAVITAPDSKPTKENTAQYTYTFAGWGIADGATVTGNATYTASFNSTVNKYTVTFVDYDGKEISKQENVDYGTEIVVPADPTRTGDAQYSYEFAGWDSEVTATVVGNVTYKATYTPTVNKYTVTWVVNNKTTYKDTYEYGVTPEYTHDAPTKADVYTYTFTGWDQEITKVTGDVTYTAQYDSTGEVAEGTQQSTMTSEKTTYKTNEDIIITVSTYEGIELDKDYVGYKSVEAWFSTGTGATKYKYIEDFTDNGDGTYSYNFGKFAEGEYTFRFVSDDKAFRGQDYLLSQMIITVEAVPTYTVTWKVEGQDDVTQTYEEGATPAYPNSAPTKAADEQYTYTFTGWNPAITTVTGAATYEAQFEATPIEPEPEPLVIDLSGISGSKTDSAGHTYFILMQNSVAYINLGTIDLSPYEIVQIRVAGKYAAFPAYDNCPIGLSNSDATIGSYNDWRDGADAADASSLFAYEKLTGMSTLDYAGSRVITLDISQNKGEEGADVYLKTVTAGSVVLYVYEIVLLPENCFSTVTWKNDDGSILKTEKVANGNTPVYTGATPTKTADDQYVYTFAGWDKELTPVDGDVTYTAQFTATPICTVTFVNSDGTTNVQTVAEGTALPAPPVTMVGNTRAMINTSATAWKDAEGNVYYYNYYISTQSEAASWTDANGDPVKVTGDMTLTQWSVVLDLSDYGGALNSADIYQLGNMSLSNAYDLGAWNLSEYSAVRFTYGASSATMSAHEVQLFTKDGDTSTTVASASLADTTGTWFTGAPTVTIDLSEISGEYTNLYIGTTSSVGCYRIEFISVN